MINVRLKFTRLLLTTDHIVLENFQYPTWVIDLDQYRVDNLLYDYAPQFKIIFAISDSLKDKYCYIWDYYREINNFNHKTAYQLYELLNDCIYSCFKMDKLEILDPNLLSIMRIIEAKFPSVIMEYKLGR